MSFDIRAQLKESDNRNKPGLVFDADTITLIGKFSDELAAYRARRKWREVLTTYFLLEHDRDYEMQIQHQSEASEWTLRCEFQSACGRYAFWRLINRQAPEAELKLHSRNMISQKAARILLGSLWNHGSPSSYSMSSKGQPTTILTGFGETKPNFFQSMFQKIGKAFN